MTKKYPPLANQSALDDEERRARCLEAMGLPGGSYQATSSIDKSAVEKLIAHAVKCERERDEAVAVKNTVFDIQSKTVDELIEKFAQGLVNTNDALRKLFGEAHVSAFRLGKLAATKEHERNVAEVDLGIAQ